MSEPSFPEQVEAARQAIGNADTQLKNLRQAFYALVATCPHDPSWYRFVHASDRDNPGARFCEVCGHDV